MSAQIQLFLASVLSLSLLTAAAPAFAASPTRVEYESGAQSAHVLAFDDEDEVAAEVVLWHVGDGKLRLDVAFPDGLTASAELDGDGDVVIMSEDPVTAAARLAEVENILAAQEPQMGTPFTCALGVVVTAGACAVAHALGCVGGAVLTACDCLPQIVKEFEGMECFE
jgi:hypothetical protein